MKFLGFFNLPPYTKYRITTKTAESKQAIVIEAAADIADCITVVAPATMITHMIILTTCSNSSATQTAKKFECPQSAPRKVEYTEEKMTAGSIIIKISIHLSSVNSKLNTLLKMNTTVQRIMLEINPIISAVVTMECSSFF